MLTPYVVLATKGRAEESCALLDCLARQSLAPARIIVVGTEAADLAGLERHALAETGKVELLLSSRAGLTCQRNVGLNSVRALMSGDDRTSLVAFFDDDFRPAPDWLERAAAVLASDPSLAGLSGRVLADGVRGQAVSEADARDYLEGRRPPDTHWSAVTRRTDVESLYGCNMAFIDQVARTCEFDEALPLYGWQEDCDYSGQARRFGRTVIDPACVGVHLGVKGARTSGVRLGYSQIANPLHIAAKGNMPWLRAARFVARALAANSARSFGAPRLFDYRGRLRGNFAAMADLIAGRCNPQRVLVLS